MTCHSLSGRACAQYKLSVDPPEDEERIDVCVEESRYSWQMSFNQRAELSLWHTNDAEFNLDCSFWCTEDGDLPEDDAGEEVTKDLIISIVSSITNF